MSIHLTNEFVRNKLIDYLKKVGTTQRHIARTAGVSDTTMSFFLRGERDLSSAKLKLIQNIISE